MKAQKRVNDLKAETPAEAEIYEIVHETEGVSSKAKILKETTTAVSFDIIFGKSVEKLEEEKTEIQKSVCYMGNMKKRQLLKEIEKVSVQ